MKKKNLALDVPWVFVSHRLPFEWNASTRTLEPAFGGLFSALRSVRWRQNVHWFGGLPASADNKAWASLTASRETADSPLHYTPVFLSECEQHNAIDGFCHDALWPLLHDEIHHMQFSDGAWSAYVEANQRIANVIAAQAPPSAHIWIHDYHLMMLPRMLRELRDDIRIGFFLYGPFPHADVFRCLPVRESLLRYWLSCDLIGFHDHSYMRHCVETLESVLGLECRDGLVTHSGSPRPTQLGVFPVAVDAVSISRKASEAEVQTCQQSLKQALDCQYLILGVDRLDHDKGIERKLQAFANMLERYPSLRDQVCLLQVTVPSRLQKPHIEQLRLRIETLVGRINGQYGKPNRAPIHYMCSTVPSRELLALYREANCLFVAGTRDGVNLVTQEYLAAQDPEDPGVLCLSEFSGAASRLPHALFHNPWDFQRAADTLVQALTMPLDERTRRFEPMRQQLLSYSATHWAHDFMAHLEAPAPVIQPPHAPSPGLWNTPTTSHPI